MGGALTIIAGVLLAALASQLAFEFRDWTPTWTDLLIKRAVRRLPVDLQDRMLEEWREFVSDAPGQFAKLKRALGLNYAAKRIVSELAGNFVGDFWPTVCIQILGLAALVFFGPPLLFTIICLAFFRGGPIFEQSKDNNFYHFRLTDDPLSSQLEHVKDLPALWNVVRGDVTLSWAQMKALPLYVLKRFLGRDD
jgi:hypothetical protein